MNAGRSSFLEFPTNLQATDPQFVTILNDRLRRIAAGSSGGVAQAAAVAPLPPSTGGASLPFVTPQSFGAKGDTIERTDGAMTSGSATLSSASGSFDTRDIGKAIWVGGAEVTATIIAVASPTSVTLSANATATVSAATYRYGTNDTAAFLSCMDAESSVYVPDGYYFITDTLKLKTSGIRIYGGGIGSTIIFRPTGYIFANYTTLDTDPVNNYVDTFFDFSIEDMKLQGGYQTPDSYTSNPTTTGRSKTFTTSDLNVGIRLKLGARVVIKGIAFERFHRGIEGRGGEINTVYGCTFLGCQAGQYLSTGFQWGNGAWKWTTHYSAKNEYRECWYGVWSDACVDASLFIGDVFQLVNTAVYLSNPNGTKFISCYCEANGEGIVTDGGYNGNIYLDQYCYEGPGAAGCYGAAILISSGPYGCITITNLATTSVGGGGVHAATGRIVMDEPRSELNQPNLNVSGVSNFLIWPDPTFTRKYIPGTPTLPSGLSAMSFSVDSEGNNVLTLTGAGGTVNYAGCNLGIYPTRFDGPLRIQFEYRYFGTTPSLQPLGIVLYDGIQNLPIGPVCEPTYVPGGITANALWTKVEAYAVPNQVLPYAAMQGNFNGYVEIRKLYISSGYGLAGNYDPNPATGFWAAAVPTAGSWHQGDFVRNGAPAIAGDPMGWVCVASGTPGTWLPVGPMDILNGTNTWKGGNVFQGRDGTEYDVLGIRKDTLALNRPEYYMSHRSNDQDLWWSATDLTTDHPWLKLLWAAKQMVLNGGVAINNDGSIFLGDGSGAPTALGWYGCSGSPNGAVTASVGSFCLNVGGGSNNTLWVKESGVNTNTGWVNYGGAGGAGGTLAVSAGGTGQTTIAAAINALIAAGLPSLNGTGISIIASTGAPTYAAPPGSIYLNTGGGAGSSLWVKETGTGTTGWVGYSSGAGSISGTVPVSNGGTGATTASAARANLGAAASGAFGGSSTTVTLAKLTSGGTNGSLTFNADGQITGRVNPT